MGAVSHYRKHVRAGELIGARNDVLGNVIYFRLLGSDQHGTIWNHGPRYYDAYPRPSMEFMRNLKQWAENNDDIRWYIEIAPQLDAERQKKREQDESAH